MVIKYQTCAFSDYKIAPGHGAKYCEVNGKSHMFINKKVHKFFRRGKKSLKMRWSIKWRTAHKKGRTEEAKKKVQRQKVQKQVKAVVGLSLDEINRIRESLKDERQNDAQRYKYAQEIKEKKKRYLEKVRKNRPERFDKTQQKAQKNMPKGKGRK